MADTKISALTVATTPLAGTEVLPIVQSGVTKQVSVANLTAGRAVSADSLTLTGTALQTGSGGTGLSSYTAGDMLYYASGTTLTKLAIGAANRVLTSSGTAPQWSTSLSLAGAITGYSVGVSANQNVITGGMWYQTSGGLLVMTPATTGGFGWNNYANTVQIGSMDNSGNTVVAGTLTSGSDFLVNAGSGNPKITVKTAGAGNNPLFRIQASTNYWDMIGIFSNADDPFRIRYNDTDFFQIANTGGVSIGNTTDPGASNLLVAGWVYTTKGTVSCTSGVATTMFTIPSNVAFFAKLDVWVSSSSYVGTATVSQSGASGATPVLLGSSTYGGITLSLSGQNVQITQPSGSTLTANWSYIRNVGS